MATPFPPRVVLSNEERSELERLVRACSTGQQLALRARIVLLAGDGWNNLQIARELGVDDETPGHWRRRWLQFRDVPLAEVSVAKRLGRCTKTWRSGEVHARAGVPDHRPGLREASRLRPTDQSMEPP